MLRQGSVRMTSANTDAELLADLDRLANELRIKTALMMEPSDPPIARP
jgi:hypothetical protein